MVAGMGRIKAGGSDVIGVLSGKGGVGKTTLVSNLGAALASEFGQKVLVIDGNVKTSHLGMHLGLYEEFPATLKEVLAKKVPVIYAVYLHPTIGLRLLPAPMKGDMDLKKMDGILKELKAAYSPILIDCAPGLGRDVIIAAKAIDKAILVTTPDLPSVTDGMKTISLLEKLKKDIIGIVLNRVRGGSYELSAEEVESACGYDVISIIPETGKIPESIAEGVPLVMNSDDQAAVELKKLAASLIGKKYQPRGFFYKLRVLFGGRLFGVNNVLNGNLNGGLNDVALREHAASGKLGTSFVREVDTRTGGKEKSMEENIEEEATVAEELRKGLRKNLRKNLNRGLRAGAGDTADLEEEIMEKIKEKLRERMGR